MLQATGLCHGTRAVACWVAGLLPARPRAPYGHGRACRGVGRPTGLSARETKLDLKLGALLNTVQGSLLPTHHAHTQTHTHTLRVAQWAHLRGLGTVA